jgi:hypothetical protein
MDSYFALAPRGKDPAMLCPPSSLSCVSGAFRRKIYLVYFLRPVNGTPDADLMATALATNHCARMPEAGALPGKRNPNAGIRFLVRIAADGCQHGGMAAWRAARASDVA